MRSRRGGPRRCRCFNKAANRNSRKFPFSDFVEEIKKIASIKPRIEIRGNDHTRPRASAECTSFNKAANRNSRKFEAAMQGSERLRASIKPRIEIRGNVIPARQPRQPLLASIKPRIEIRGNRSSAG